MRAWWVYWVSVAVAAMLWIGIPLLAGRDGLAAILHQPIGLAALLSPLIVAGVNLIMFRASHEEVCRLEAQRHAWLRAMVGNGYSARTFGLTGIGLLVVVAVIVAAVATGNL
jgi:hypothetical protein